MFRTAMHGVTAALVIATLIAPGSVAAAPASGDFVSGSGYRLNDIGEKRVHFKVDARQTGAGSTGRYAYRSVVNDLTFSGAIDCLIVSGTRSSISGVITSFSGDDFDYGFGVGDSFVVFFDDNGSPYRNQAGPDLVSFTDIYLADDPAFPGCSDPWAHGDWVLVDGNINVKDAP